MQTELATFQYDFLPKVKRFLPIFFPQTKWKIYLIFSKVVLPTVEYNSVNSLNHNAIWKTATYFIKPYSNYDNLNI